MWIIKVFIQFVLGHLPFGERLNFQLQLLRGSHSPEKMKGRIWSTIETLNRVREHMPHIREATVVEIGTGWYAIMPIMLYLYGVRRCFTYDHVPHVRFKLVREFVRVIGKNIEDFSKRSNIPLSELAERLEKIAEKDNLEDFLKAANIDYVAPGDASNTGLNDRSVDLVMSYAVLEHVPREVVSSISNEAAKILHANGICYHLIGLHDHYSCVDPSISKINFLKYSSRFWRFFVQNRISYHNRLREPEFLKIFDTSRLDVSFLNSKVDQRDIEQIGKMKIAREFEGFDARELAVHEMEVVLSSRSDVTNVNGIR